MRPDTYNRAWRAPAAGLESGPRTPVHLREGLRWRDPPRGVCEQRVHRVLFPARIEVGLQVVQVGQPLRQAEQILIVVVLRGGDVRAVPSAADLQLAEARRVDRTVDDAGLRGRLL